MTKEELQEKVSRLFSEKQGKHDGPSIINQTYNCTKCGALMESCNKPTTASYAPCPVPDPIDITDLGKALECFRGLRKQSVITIHHIDKVFGHSGLIGLDYMRGDVWEWISVDATAAQIWEICCLAKEEESK